MIIAIAKYFAWPLDQLDRGEQLFLYGIMKEQVFCAVPEGVDLDGDFDCLELVKAIYGLKQASRVWNETFDGSCAPSAFKFGVRPVPLRQDRYRHCVLVLVYVDDVLIYRKFTRTDLTHEDGPQNTLRDDRQRQVRVRSWDRVGGRPRRQCDDVPAPLCG
ncbi:hypothetical protein Pcac1_g29479 [Phytophthora cactorum]|nr:hypothetical protein Pcac1_g29479 [Phytophthora cactorum]